VSVEIITPLIEVLKADGVVSGLVSDRVFGKELPRPETDAMPRKAVVIQASGGVPLTGGFAEITSQRFDAISYGETPFEATKVENAVFAVFKRLRRQVISGVLLHWIEDAGGFTSGRDADADWPLDARSYQVLFATVAP